MSSRTSSIFWGALIIIFPITIALFYIFYVAHDPITPAHAVRIFIVPVGFMIPGTAIMIKVIRDYKHYKYILKYGYKTYATIIDYVYNNNPLDTDSLPRIDLVVTFDVNDQKKISRIETNTTNMSRYPVGSKIEVAILANEVAHVK